VVAIKESFALFTYYLVVCVPGVACSSVKSCHHRQYYPQKSLTIWTTYENQWTLMKHMVYYLCLWS